MTQRNTKTPTVHELYAQQDQRAERLGWQRVSEHGCPRRLVGKRCLKPTFRNPDRRCWCQNSLLVHQLRDHAGTWRHETGPYKGQKFVLWEPYGADGESLAALNEIASADGLEVCVTASVWNPPGTVGIAFYPRDYWASFDFDPEVN